MKTQVKAHFLKMDCHSRVFSKKIFQKEPQPRLIVSMMKAA
uniref:Uncharacterized protein n=1 Tax=Arundo donax TaxID=35708 RepID=A0A0A9FUW4_ARUDO